MFFFARSAPGLQRSTVASTTPSFTCHSRSLTREMFRILQIRSVRASTKSSPSNFGRKSAAKVRLALHKPPPTLFALPLYRRPAFPGFYQVIQIRDRELIDHLAHLKRKKKEVLAGFMCKGETHKEDNKEGNSVLRIDSGIDFTELEEVGTVFHIINVSVHERNSGAQLVVLPKRRIRRTSFHSEEKPLAKIMFEELPADEREVDQLEQHLLAKHREILNKMKELVKTSYVYREHYDQVIRFYNTDIPSKVSDLVCGMSMAKRDELQLALEETDLDKKLDRTLSILEGDLAFSRIQSDVKLQVENRMNKDQKRYIMMEQLKHLKRELGLERDDKSVLIQNFKEAVLKKDVPDDIRETIDHEIQKLTMLEAASSEFNVSRTYLEWLTALPWGITTTDNRDINAAQKMLEEDHHGLEDVKDRILEFMAVSFLRGQAMPGKIMCMVGPPGVGKTSLGKSIARALGRNFYRFSVGGLTDVAEIRGHRRTYIGSMPGKLIQCLRNVQSMNPVVLIDEIDKIGKDFRGDPSSALLEVLDPEQNNQFRDYYLDVPVSLKQILFVCTANTTDTIPAPLLDRMEVIRLSGYVFEEKLSIAKEYLIPQTVESTGLQKAEKTDVADSGPAPKADLNYLSEDVLSHLIRDYAREAGVRSLQRYIEKIHRKIALQIVRDENAKIDVNLGSLHDFVGQPVYLSERMYEDTPPGVVMGLAWTSMGGATLYVEASALSLHGERQKGALKVTGQLGNVMTESTQIAHSYAKKIERHLYAHVDRDSLLFPRSDGYPLEDWNIHLHVPEGATPKDGPSAGITLCTALLSLSLNLPVPKDLAMTGEMSLTGKVLRIGGLKEKTVAAKRENAKMLIFPRSNERDYDELKDYLKEGLTAHFVESYDEVIEIIWPQLTPYLNQKGDVSWMYTNFPKIASGKVNTDNLAP